MERLEAAPRIGIKRVPMVRDGKPVGGGVVHVWSVVVTANERAAVTVAVENVSGVKKVRANVEALPSYMRPFLRWGDTLSSSDKTANRSIPAASDRS
ncbi:MAG: hypothetical protein ABIL01_05180 [Pseudomonadota bacterium]